VEYRGFVLQNCGYLEDIDMWVGGAVEKTKLTQVPLIFLSSKEEKVEADFQRRVDQHYLAGETHIQFL